MCYFIVKFPIDKSDISMNVNVLDLFKCYFLYFFQLSENYCVVPGISWKVGDLLLSVRCITKATQCLHRKFSHCTSVTSIARLSFNLVTDAVLIQVCCFIFFTENCSNEANCQHVLLATFVSMCLPPCAHTLSGSGQLNSLDSQLKEHHDILFFFVIKSWYTVSESSE